MAPTAWVRIPSDTPSSYSIKVLQYIGNVPTLDRYQVGAPVILPSKLTKWKRLSEEQNGLERYQGSAPKITVRSSAEEFWSSKPAVGSSNLSGPAKIYTRVAQW